jgi:hypothetical protein
MQSDKHKNPQDELICLFSKAIGKLIEQDSFLLESNVQERTIAARLAMYLRDDLLCAEEDGIFVDVEYNRDGVDLKRPDPQVAAHWIAPDILIHERGSRKNNYRNDIVYCEIKKHSHSCADDAERISKQIQLRHYQFGIDLYSLSLEDIRLDLYIGQNPPKKYKYDFEKRCLISC